ncbi:hypothetical protein CK203_024892 [Vitis vinifera]|uniref:Uncharacterized protein n=1 Tax=Vitis vinifera TaxID=29760 RepID=A0A438ITC3_VITVI|nr:hypothetical protein CK203_024892 [Vitis vinifera]
MTKFSGFWILFLVVGTPFMFLHCSGSSIPDGGVGLGGGNRGHHQQGWHDITGWQLVAAGVGGKEKWNKEQKKSIKILTYHTFLSLFPDMVFTHHVGSATMKATSRKLKVGYEHNLGTDKKIIAGNVNLEDYHPIDPVPSSKASIKPGPIQHGTPLIPYIPKPSPPGHPKPGGFF